MANNHLIRPPVLVQNPPNPAVQNDNQNQNPPMSEAAMSELITRLVSQTLQREGRAIINTILNPPADNSINVDQVINPNPNGILNLSDMDKIPDVVKSLRDFSGQDGEFSSWRKSVERILNIYESLKGTPKYYGILSVIRNKIVGQADIVLESYNTPLNWTSISKCLNLHYADKRDLGTLEYQMTTLVQGNKSIHDFYQVVYHHLSLILNKLSAMDISRESMNNLVQTYRDKALDTFIRGLKGDLPRLLSIKEPTDLPQALHLCLKLQNVDFRVQYANNGNSGIRKFHTQTPPIPPRRNMSYSAQTLPIPAPRKTFFPELYHNPQKFQNQYQQQYPQFRNHYQERQPQNNFRSLPPRPLPRAEPMEVDRSIHSKVVNYQNHPRSFPAPQKRTQPQTSQHIRTPNKYQRIFNTEQQEESSYNENTVTKNEQIAEYANQIEQEDANHEQTLMDFVNEQDGSYDMTETPNDIYFLD